jgi:hypothetical protein
MNELRESLQTVLWPQMIRKPLPSRTPRRESRSSGASGVDLVDPVQAFAPEDGVDLVHEAQALDAWLDSDDVFPAPTRLRMSDGIGETFDDDFRPFQSAPPASHDQSNPSNRSPPQDDLNPSELDEQEDDDPLLPTDPTPLLHHLSSIRDALARVDDPDERRRRAARELEAVFSGLGIDVGLGELDLDLEELQELDG